MRAVAAAVAVMLVVASPKAAPDWTRHFDGIKGTFVLLNGRTGQYTRHDAVRATERFAPCSTFKIPNTAILLESGAAPDPDYTVAYDPALKQEGNWARDHTLRSAFTFSVLWYYQTLAQRIGLPAEQRFLHQFHYGNENTSGGTDKTGTPFWVDGTLRISADEQVEFLKRLHDGRLGLSERTTRLTKEVMVAEQTPTFRLSAKTGACHPAGEDVALWYVGIVERPDDELYYFAMEMGDAQYEPLFSTRVSKPRAILTDWASCSSLEAWASRVISASNSRNTIHASARSSRTTRRCSTSRRPPSGHARGPSSTSGSGPARCLRDVCEWPHARAHWASTSTRRS